MHPQQSNCRTEECGHYDKCFWVESGTREEQVILLEAPLERLAPQSLVVLSCGVKDESLPSWEMTSASPFYMLRKEPHTAWWGEAEQQAWPSRAEGQ